MEEKPSRLDIEAMLKELVEKMGIYSDKNEFEKARKVLDDIESEIKNVRPSTTEDLMLPMKVTRRTIKSIYRWITGNSVRLDEKDYGFPALFNLTLAVKDRENELIDDYNKRKVIAEEMVCAGMSIKEKSKGKKPNRAFLDIAFKVNPSLSCKEISRRERVKLWKAMESSDEKEVSRIKKQLSDIMEFERGD